MSKIIGVICTKGGVGKTTTTANLGAILADMKQRVLLIDADPQQSLSRLFEIPAHTNDADPQQALSRPFEIVALANFGLSQLYKSANPAQCISKTGISGLDIVLNDDPSSDGIIPAFLRESFTHIQHLRIALTALEEQYDYILIDTQGAKGMVQESVIFAADTLISPIQPKILDTREFICGTVELVNKFKPRPGYNTITGRPLPPIKVLVNMWDRTLNSQEILRVLRSQFDRETDGAITVLNTVIPDLSVYSASSGKGQPAHRAEVARRGPTLPACDLMMNLVHELEPKLSDIKPDWPGKTRAPAALESVTGGAQ